MYNLDYVTKKFWFISKDKTVKLPFPTLERWCHGIASFNDKYIYHGGGYSRSRDSDNREIITEHDSVIIYYIDNAIWSSFPTYM